MVRYLQRVLLNVPINWLYLHEDAGKTCITSIGPNAMRHHNLNVLPLSLVHALPYIFSQFNMDRP